MIVLEEGVKRRKFGKIAFYKREEEKKKILDDCVVRERETVKKKTLDDFHKQDSLKTYQETARDELVLRRERM
jgi:hypothetical protein